MIEAIFTKRCPNCQKRTVVIKTRPSWHCSNCGIELTLSFVEVISWIVIVLLGVIYVTITPSMYVYRPEIFLFLAIWGLIRYFLNPKIVK